MENGKAFSVSAALAREAASRAENEAVQAQWILVAEMWDMLRLEHDLVARLRESALFAGNLPIEHGTHAGH